MPKSQKRIIHCANVSVEGHGDSQLRLRVFNGLNPNSLSVTFVIETWRWSQTRSKVAEIGRSMHQRATERAQRILNDTQ